MINTDINNNNNNNDNIDSNNHNNNNNNNNDNNQDSSDKCNNESNEIYINANEFFVPNIDCNINFQKFHNAIYNQLIKFIN